MTNSAAPPPRYAFRPPLRRSERLFTLGPEGLDAGRRRFAYRDIERVRLYQVRAQDGGMIERCTLHAGRRTVSLQSLHIAGWAKVQDRKAEYEPFVRALLLRIGTANPAVRVFAGMPWTSRAGWLFVVVLVVALGLGGVALLAAGDWEGLWLIGIALTTGPLAVAMSGKKPSRLVDIKEIAAPGGFRNLFS